MARGVSEYPFDLECDAPHPYHRNWRCNLWENDSIHEPVAPDGTCEGEQCINPEAHHDFIPSTPLRSLSADPEAWEAQRRINDATARRG